MRLICRIFRIAWLSRFASAFVSEQKAAALLPQPIGGGVPAEGHRSASESLPTPAFLQTSRLDSLTVELSRQIQSDLGKLLYSRTRLQALSSDLSGQIQMDLSKFSYGQTKLHALTTDLSSQIQMDLSKFRSMENSGTRLNALTADLNRQIQMDLSNFSFIENSRARLDALSLDLSRQIQMDLSKFRSMAHSRTRLDALTADLSEQIQMDLGKLGSMVPSTWSNTDASSESSRMPLLSLLSSDLAKWGLKEGNCTTDPIPENARNTFTYPPLSDSSPLHVQRLLLNFIGTCRSNLMSVCQAIFILLVFCVVLVRMCSYRKNHGYCIIPRLPTKEQQRKHLAKSLGEDFSGQAAYVDVTAEEFCSGGANALFGIDTLKAFGQAKKALTKGNRVFVHGRAATLVYGPDIDGEFMVKFDDDGRNSAFLPPDLIKKVNDGPPLLELEPKDVIRVSCNGPNTFLVSNASAGHVAFRMKATAPKEYSVRPARSTLRPQEKLVVRISPKHDRASTDVQFLVMAAPVNLPGEVTVEEWQQIPENVIEQYTLSTIAEDIPEQPEAKPVIPALSLSELGHEKFKIGDSVVSVMETSGTVGQIVEVDSSERPFKVRWEDGSFQWYKKHWISEAENLEPQRMQRNPSRSFCNEFYEIRESTNVASSLCPAALSARVLRETTANSKQELLMQATEAQVVQAGVTHPATLTETTNLAEELSVAHQASLDAPVATIGAPVEQCNEQHQVSWLGTMQQKAFKYFVRTTDPAAQDKASEQDIGIDQPVVTSAATLESVWQGLLSLDHSMESLGWLARQPARQPTENHSVGSPLAPIQE